MALLEQDREQQQAGDCIWGTLPVVQQLRLQASNAWWRDGGWIGVGSIPGQGTKIPHALRCSQKVKKKKKKIASGQGQNQDAGSQT